MKTIDPLSINMDISHVPTELLIAMFSFDTILKKRKNFNTYQLDYRIKKESYSLKLNEEDTGKFFVSEAINHHQMDW